MLSDTVKVEGRAPGPEDLPAIDEARRSHLRLVTLERDIFREKLMSLGYTPAGLDRWIANARDGRRK